MNLEIPDGAKVQVMIGKVPFLAMPDGTEAEPPKPSPVRSILRATIAVLLLPGAFIGGRLVGAHGAHTGLASAAEAVPYPPLPPVRQGFPDRALADPAANAAGQVPEAFQRDLQQQPTVVPPPGQPAASPPTAGKNAFGLKN